MGSELQLGAGPTPDTAQGPLPPELPLGILKNVILKKILLGCVFCIAPLGCGQLFHAVGAGMGKKRERKEIKKGWTPGQIPSSG